MSPELSRLHLLLNSEAVVPALSYRRNKVVYELVCYVNCLIGCVLSDRRDVMPVFVERCGEFIGSHPSPEHAHYYSVVQDYLAEVERVFDLERRDANA
jgi:hypothetical protein